MRTLSALLIVVAGFSQWGCGDSKSGPPLGPDTSWQFGCSTTATSCGSVGSSPHGPIGGKDPTTDADDQDLKVTCSSDASGLAIHIEDPGLSQLDPKHPEIKTRSPSVLDITNAKGDTNTCFVSLEETITTGAHYKLQDACTGNSQAAGSCTLTGTKDSNGYAFEGTLVCTGMKVNGAGPPDYRLGAAVTIGDPIKLEIVHCN